MSRLDELKIELTRATMRRRDKIAALEAEIRRTNKDYDREATKLAREIAKLEPVITPAPERETAPKPRPKAKKEPDVWAKINEWNREHTQ